MRGDLLVRGIGELATPRGKEPPRGREAMGRVEVTRGAAVLIVDGTIEYVGAEAGLDAAVAELSARDPAIAARLARAAVLDAGGRAVVPGFVDSHTHLVFSGYRDDEFLWRAGGVPYMEIHARGGGIGKSVGLTRAASLGELVALGEARLRKALALGVTTMEGKSGYGLETATELRQLEAMSILQKRCPIELIPTFMGPHSTPPEHKGRSAGYLELVIREMLPAVAAQGVARYADIFCEKGVFSVEESRRFLLAARELGLGLRIHADEIERTGGAGLAAELGCASADHLLKADPADIRRMAEAGVVATALPLTAFSLREPYADARLMIDSGCALALASDLNPGSCYSQSFPLMFAIAVLYMGLGMEEALTAATLGGAAALGIAHRVGSIEAGKDGDLLVLDAPSFRHLAYNVGMNQVAVTVKAGEIAHRA